MKCLFYVLMSLMLMTPLMGQSKVTELPDISVIGNFVATSSKSKKTADVKELEFAFQHYLYPSVKADVFVALHKESTGKRNIELEEAYVTFSDFWGTIISNSKSNVGLGLLLGKKRLSIGKNNPLHPEQYTFIDRSIATQQFLGGEEGLAAEGAAVQYLLPLPFFSQVEAGYWAAASHAEETGTTESHGVEYSNHLFHSRLWNSIAVSDTQEMQFGLSYLLGNANQSQTNQQQALTSIDLTHNIELTSSQYLQFQAEWYNALYGENGEARHTQTGGFISGEYQFNPSYQFATRYSVLNKHGDEGNKQTMWSLLVTRQLTDTSKFRIQHNSGENVEDTVLVQFIFGIGPHSHVLQ